MDIRQKARPVETIKVSEIEINPEVVIKISPSIARIYMIMPMSFAGNTLTIATANPHNIRLLDDLRFMLNVEIEAVLSTEDEIKKAIDRHYGPEGASATDLLAQIEQGREIDAKEIEIVDVEELQKLAEGSSVIRLLNLILGRAMKERVSDIHFEPFGDQFKVRYRIDGALYDTTPPPKHLGIGISSRLKVLAGMNIAERRIPQSGRIELKVGGREIDLRVSTLPTVFGESIVLRVLDRSIVMFSLNQLGMAPNYLKIFEQLIQKPNGIILVTGPTGCGKTTTLYSALASLDSDTTKIITTEDPVEYDIPGITQVHIREQIGLTFARCLRHILRQDPDIVFVGELRDPETAQMAIQASLTGHLVFSTLHTTDTATTIIRLIDMGIEPFLITSTLEAALTQRLVRTICQNCREPYQPTEEELRSVRLTTEGVRGRTFYRGKGCDLCNNIGYKGRTGIFELLVLDDNVRILIMKKASARDIHDETIRQGLKTMREDGLEKVYQGITTIEEITGETM